MAGGPCEQWQLLIKSRLIERKKLEEQPLQEIIEYCTRASEFISIVTDIGSCSVVNINSEQDGPITEKTLSEKRLEREKTELQSTLDQLTVEINQRIVYYEQQLMDKQKLLDKLENQVEELNRKNKDSARERVAQIKRVSQLEIFRQESVQKNIQLEKENKNLKIELAKVKDENSLHSGGIARIEGEFGDLVKVFQRMNDSISLLREIRANKFANETQQLTEPQPGTSRTLPLTVINNPILPQARLFATLPEQGPNGQTAPTDSSLRKPTHSTIVQKAKKLLFIPTKNSNSLNSHSSPKASDPSNFTNYFFTPSDALKPGAKVFGKCLSNLVGSESNISKLPKFAASSVKWVADRDKNLLQVLVGGTDGMVQVFRFDGGSFVKKQLNRAKGTITSLDFNNSNIIASSTEHTAWLWSGIDGTVKLRFTGHKSDVTSVKFVADGSKFISGSRDKTLRLFDIKTKKCIEVFNCNSPCNQVDFCKPFDVVSAHEDKTIRYWDARTPSPVSSGVLGGEVTSVSFSQNGWQLLASAMDKELVILDFRTNRIVQSFTPGWNQFKLSNNLARPAFSPDSRYVAVGSAQGYVHIWSTMNDNELQIIKMIGGQPVLSCAWDQSGKNFICCSKNVALTVQDFDPYKISRFEGPPIEKITSPNRRKSESSGGGSVGLSLRW